MIELNSARFKTKPFKHQLDGMKALVQRPAFALFDEMRLGKTKQVIDAACSLAEAGCLSCVVVVAPAGVRNVWASSDPERGEIRKHAWIKTRAWEFHSRGLRTVWEDGAGPHKLNWIVTNYEFIRARERSSDRWVYPRVKEIIAALPPDGKTMIVLDESSYIKERKAAQTKACLLLAQRHSRRVILNGTPVVRGPLDLWTQANFLSKNILPFRNFYAFRDRYAVMGGWMGKEVVRYQNLDELSALMSPYCLQRKLRDCFDLPADLPTQYREVPLLPATWRHYVSVRADMLAWLDRSEPSLVATTAAVKALRLAQLCGGFLGGMPGTDSESFAEPISIGREKLDATVNIVKELRGVGRPVIVWCRFRAERERLFSRISEILTELDSADEDQTCRLLSERVYQVYGGQGRVERELAISKFARGQKGFNILLAQPAAGGLGLDLSAASDAVHYSRDFGSLAWWQSSARVHHGLKNVPCGATVLLATGPKGERTVDHAIDKALKGKEDVAVWTAARWRRELIDE